MNLLWANERKRCIFIDKVGTHLLIHSEQINLPMRYNREQKFSIASLVFTLHETFTHPKEKALWSGRLSREQSPFCLLDNPPHLGKR